MSIHTISNLKKINFVGKSFQLPTYFHSLGPPTLCTSRLQQTLYNLCPKSNSLLRCCLLEFYFVLLSTIKNCTKFYSPAKGVNLTFNFPGDVTVATPDTFPSFPVLKIMFYTFMSHFLYNKIPNVTLTIDLFVDLQRKRLRFPFYHMLQLYICRLFRTQRDIFQLRTTVPNTENN